MREATIISQKDLWIPMFRRRWLAVAAVVSAIALALMVSAPFMAPYGTFTGLDGSAANIEHGWLGHGPAGLAYLIGDVFCHQQEARSFILNGSQMPVCIRDTGILVGLVAGFCACWLMDRRMSDRRTAVAGVLLVALMAAEWLVEGRIGDMPWVRFASGIAGGLGAAMFLSWMLYRDTESDNPW